MRVLLSVYVWVAGFVLTIFLFLAELFFFIILFPFDKKRKVVHMQAFWWANAILNLNPYWHISVSGLKNVDPRETYVIVANHQSLADIILMYKVRIQFRWIAKDVLFKLPFLGWAMSLAQHIRLSRGQFGSIKKVYRKAAKWLKKDVSVVFFPEGSRSNTNDMGKFQNGAFKLAIKEKRPILPVAISGTREAIPKGGWVFKKNVSGNLRILPPIATVNFKPGDFGQLRDLVYAKLEKARVE